LKQVEVTGAFAQVRHHHDEHHSVNPGADAVDDLERDENVFVLDEGEENGPQRDEQEGNQEEFFAAELCPLRGNRSHDHHHRLRDDDADG
jgi:hypothetical protein